MSLVLRLKGWETTLVFMYSYSTCNKCAVSEKKMLQINLCDPTAFQAFLPLSSLGGAKLQSHLCLSVVPALLCGPSCLISHPFCASASMALFRVVDSFTCSSNGCGGGLIPLAELPLRRRTRDSSASSRGDFLSDMMSCRTSPFGFLNVGT